MPFETLPGHARLWLLALSSRPGPAVQAQLQAALAEVLGQWRHKGQTYPGEGALLEGQILVVAEARLSEQPSGCAIDGMLGRLRRRVEAQGLGLVDPEREVLVRLDGELRAFPKTRLPELLQEGRLGPETPVLDLSLFSLSDLREGRLESPLASTWIARRHLSAGTPALP